jgi:RNA polymerase sigma-70 factor, ECF subfamily
VTLSRKAVLSFGVGQERPGKQDLARLIQLIAEGDESAFAPLYDATSGLLFGLLLLILGDTATAEEVLSDVYTEVRQQANRFDKRHEWLATWLITIAHRHALEYLRSSNIVQRPPVSIGLAGQNSLTTGNKIGMSKAEHQRLVCSTLDSLSPVQRKMIELAYFSGMRPREIAMNLEQPLETVKSGLQQGMLKLYRLFKSRNSFSERQTGTHRIKPSIRQPKKNDRPDRVLTRLIK